MKVDFSFSFFLSCNKKFRAGDHKNMTSFTQCMHMNTNIHTNTHTKTHIQTHIHKVDVKCNFKSISSSRVLFRSINDVSETQKHKLYHQLCPKSFFIVTVTGGRSFEIPTLVVYNFYYGITVYLHFRIFSLFEIM